MIGIIILFVLISAMVFFAFLGEKYSDELFDAHEKLGEVPSPSTKAAAKKLRSVWEKSVLFFSLTIEEHELERISDSIVRLVSFSDGDDVSEYRYCKDLLRKEFEFLRSCTGFSFTNII